MGQREPWEGGPRAVSAGDCLAQLARILDSAEFDTTDRGRRFLRYVVEEALAGRGDRIKAYSVAVEVFGRDASFDPQSDPIVRIEAGHLRRALERYYLTGGVADPIRITIPKGGYLPAFSAWHPDETQPAKPEAAAPEDVATPPVPEPLPRNDAAPSGFAARRPSVLAATVVAALLAVGSAAWWWVASGAKPTAPENPSLLVQPFEDLSGTPASAAIASGLSQEIVGQLSKFKDIVVHESVDAHPAEPAFSPRYALAGSVDLSTDAFRLRVRLMNRADGAVLGVRVFLRVLQVGLGRLHRYLLVFG